MPLPNNSHWISLEVFSRPWKFKEDVLNFVCAAAGSILTELTSFFRTKETNSKCALRVVVQCDACNVN